MQETLMVEWKDIELGCGSHDGAVTLAGDWKEHCATQDTLSVGRDDAETQRSSGFRPITIESDWKESC